MKNFRFPTASKITSVIQPSLKDTQRLQLNRAGRNVAFALHPQHETSCDSEIQTKADFKSKLRKQLGSLALLPLNSTDKDDALDYQC